MTPHDLLANFETLAEAPNGIQRLRELVLELAVRGKLIEQDSQDEPVHCLIERVRHGAEQLQKKDRIRINKHLAPVSEPDCPFEIPSSWSWVRMGQLACSQAGFAFKSTHFNEHGKGMPLIRIRDIFRTSTEAFYDGEFRDEFIVEPGDQLVGMDGLFKVAKWTGPTALLNQRVSRLIYFSTELLQPFFGYALQRHLDSLHGSKAYTTVQHLSGKQIETSPIPLPPIEEQSRIVARVDELMALLDRLEAQRQDREADRTSARDSALAALREAPTPEDVETAWLRIQERFHELFTTPEDVEPLRALTLELAVRGKLVEQDQEDEPASNLLIRAKARKSTLPGSSRHGRTLPPAETERPFDLPKGWSWARMDDFCDIKSGVAKGKNLQGIECHHFPYLRVANVQAGYTDLAVMKTIPLPVAELDTYRLVKGDVLLTEGGDWDKLGRSAVWGGQVDPCIHQNHVFRARSLEQGIHPRWISSFTNSPDGRSYFQSCSKQTTNLASINMTQLKCCLVPIPPSAEQDRILARMDELMALLERLSESLSGQSRLAQAFAAAAVHHLDA